MHIPDIQYKVVLEAEMTAEEPRQAGEILPPEWVAGADAEAAEILHRGWVQTEPVCRVLAHTPDGLLVAQGSLVDITTEQAAYPYDGTVAEPKILGLAEGVVRPGYRGQHIGSKAMELRVEKAQDLGAEVVMTASDKPHVRSTLGRLGFRCAQLGEIFFSEGPYRQVYNPSWLILGSPPRSPWQIAHDF